MTMRIAVVGAGIIGATIATRLISAGHDVTVFEPEPDGLPTSAGNASLIALPEIAPIANPGILTAVPGWLLDPLGPLTIRWKDVPALLPWLLAFLASATPARGLKARNALTFLMRNALEDHEELGRKAGLTGHLRKTGYISVHGTEASVDAALKEAAAVKSVLGYDFARLTPAEARKLVPQLEGSFSGAVHHPVYWTATDPLTILRHYQSYVAGKGRLVPARVKRLRRTDTGIEVQAASGNEIFDKVVVAAGVWSRDLVRDLGGKVLLETERGYNTTFTNPGWNLALPLGFADDGFVAAPLVSGLRVGGAVELAKPETSPNFARAKAMLTKMRRYVPSLPEEGGAEWMGRRPSTPDSLPVISRHPGEERIVHAFGHGHLGLTLSAVTARLVENLLKPGSADPSLAPFSINRFQ